jgi:hypothetical protein
MGLSAFALGVAVSVGMLGVTKRLLAKPASPVPDAGRTAIKR